MNKETRTEAFKKNSDLESLLNNINAQILPLQLPSDYKYSQNPTLFILGAPRSGTTLLTQWLASLDIFAYPTNLMSRFFKNPVLGGYLQQLLFDESFRFKAEFDDLNTRDIIFESNIGKTKSVLSPNEFWYFWRKFYAFPEIFDKQKSIDKIQTDFNFKSFFYEIDQIKAIFNRPFFTKGLIINEYLRTFYNENPNIIYLYIHRNLKDNAISLLNTRFRFSQDINQWYSFKNTNYNLLKQMNPFDQVVNQVNYLNNTISEDLKFIPDKNKVIISYEEFCSRPDVIFEQLKDRLEFSDCEYNGVPFFRAKGNSGSEYEKDVIQSIKKL